jgi:hypothetical protein
MLGLPARRQAAPCPLLINLCFPPAYLPAPLAFRSVMPDMPNGFNEADASQVVAVDFRTLPGGPYERYSEGRTLTHELGH